MFALGHQWYLARHLSPPKKIRLAIYRLVVADYNDFSNNTYTMIVIILLFINMKTD